MNRTKQLICDTFWQLLEEKPYNKITVRDIVDRCGINRNTFYYYFHDIPEVLEVSTREDTDTVIQAYSKSGSPMDSITPLVEHCRQRRKAILHLYHSAQRELFLNQLEQISLYAVTRYVDTVAEDLTISPEDRELLIRFYKCFLVGVLLDWLDHGMDYDIVKCFKRLEELHGDAGWQALLAAAESAGD